ncbi:MAG: VOC family protein, partial [Thermoplasmataceae archaeon]
MSEEGYFSSVDAVEYYVGSARQWAYYHQKALGFNLVGYAGPETGVRDRVSYLLQQGEVRLIFTSYLDHNSPIADHVRLHGDGVRDVSMSVPNVEDTVEFIERKGVARVRKPEKVKTRDGYIKKSLVYAYGDTLHSLNDYSEAEGNLPPGFEALDAKEKGSGLKKIDHIVGNVEERMMDRWVRYYINGLGFDQLISFDDKDISTEYSALRSKVVHYGNRKIIFPINEPALGLKKSQIQEYIDYYNSPGVQHIALETDNIIKTVSELRSRGIEFLPTPHTYYENLLERVGKIDEK